MKINFDATLNGLDGQPLEKAKGLEITLKSAATEALIGIFRSDERATGEQKFKRHQLAEKINAGGEVEITPEEASLIKERIGEAFGAAVVGPAWKLLNG